jgi:hypothetical protein
MRVFIGTVGIAASVVIVQASCVARPSAVTPSDSEVATSVVSGGLNNTSGSLVAMNTPVKSRRSFARRVVDAVNPIGTAWAATWTCAGGGLSPTFAGPGDDPYAYTPRNCSITWDNGRTASSSWSGPFTLNYGSSCDDTHPFMEDQVAGCTLTRTTSGSGDTRTITGPDGNSYAINHDTDGAGTGWDPSVTPAPANGGVELTCASGGCEAGKTLVVNGSHLTGTVTIGSKSETIWDHTVSTGSSGITVTGSGTTRVVTGSVTVQHNLARYTATATFNSVAYGQPLCCFPTSGNVSTTFENGPDEGKHETLAFSAICGEATLTTADGSVDAITLEHCL